MLDDLESSSDPITTADTRAVRLSEEVGVTRAMRGIHPLESVRAAIEMFKVLLPVVVRELQKGDGGDDAIAAGAVVLNAAIMRRVGLGAVSYATYLRKKVNSSHRDERSRIARELHDRAAHSIGVALQDLGLHDVYLEGDPERARRKVTTARELMLDALAAVREIAQELHDSTTEHGGLRNAVLDYARAHVTADIAVDVSVAGDLEGVPLEVSEELYIVLREAIRNSVRHAAPHTVFVDIDIQDGKAVARVVDDGCGFEATTTSGGIGLRSMSERIDLLGGNLMVTSAEGIGTTVSISVPLTETS
ncbi:MAG TPA: sensor histidine kinase [Actinomycetes bacterium]|nr:sensor histidine kinase [Actinomycetes bacterium]